MKVIVLTTHRHTASQSFGVLKGVTSKLIPSFDDESKAIQGVITELRESGAAVAGEPIVVVHGAVAKKGATNTMKIEYA
jgi:pyruvate kinase